MNTSEFNQWWTDFKLRFPDMGSKWFPEGRSDSQQRVILSNFADVLSDVELTEAIAVNRAMLKGDLASFAGHWDRDLVATKVRLHALSLRPNCDGTEDSPALLPRGMVQQPVGIGLGGALRQLRKMQQEGASKEDCAEFLRQAFPPSPHESQWRYDCKVCWDRGRVEVWHWELVIRVKQGQEDAINSCIYRTSTAACSCGAGMVFQNRKIPLVRYDESRHCRVRNGDTSSDAAVKDFREWIADLGSVANRENYEPGFAEYSK